MLYWLAIYGTFANWVATALAAIWGAGSMMAIASAGYEGTAFQESLIMALLFSLSLAMIGVVGLVLWGLRRGRRSANLTP
jgi:hydroxylaminobenzene mutase